MKPADIKQISELLDQKFEPIHEELKTHSGELKKHTKIFEQHGEMLEDHGRILGQHSKMLEDHGKILRQHGRMLRSLKKDQDTMLNMLDREQMNQRKRLERIEDHLVIPPYIS